MEQDHPGSAGAVSSSEPLQQVHLPGFPVTRFILDRDSWQYALRLSKRTTNDCLEGQERFPAMSTGHRATRPCSRLPTQTQDHVVSKTNYLIELVCEGSACSLVVSCRHFACLKKM